MNNNFTKKYQHLTHDDTKFSISSAIMFIIETNHELYIFTEEDFELAVLFIVEAWNLAIINDDEIISILIKKDAKRLKKVANKPQKQIEAMLMSLIKMKKVLYGDVYRIIGDYEATFKNDEPYLKIASGKDMPADYFANYYREILFNNKK
ncbi:MAG: hypothetical protein RLZZ293_456 [Pseudomonadota bacterium]|jgi:hypothetical protein